MQTNTRKSAIIDSNLLSSSYGDDINMEEEIEIQ
jgi:hypothetical protein